MAQRSISFLVVLLLIFYGELFGQENPQNFQGKTTDSPEIVPKKSMVISKWPVTYKALQDKDRKTPGLSAIDCTSGKLTYTPMTFRLPHRNNNIGFICKKELQLDKITTIAVRFRLGSLNYVNWMEQKPNSNKE